MMFHDLLLIQGQHGLSLPLIKFMCTQHPMLPILPHTSLVHTIGNNSRIPLASQEMSSKSDQALATPLS